MPCAATVNDVCFVTMRSHDELAIRYLDAKRTVIEAGYFGEIFHFEHLSFEALAESQLLREHAWVVIASGLSDRVVSSVFPALTAAFEQWTSARAISENRTKCRRAALRVFGNKRKIEAIRCTAEIVLDVGFAR